MQADGKCVRSATPPAPAGLACQTWPGAICFAATSLAR